MRRVGALPLRRPALWLSIPCLALCLQGCAPRLLTYGELQPDNLRDLVDDTATVRGLAPRQPIPFRLVARTALQPERFEEPGEADALRARSELLGALGVVQGSESLLDAQRRMYAGGALFGFYAGSGRGITVVDTGLRSDIGELVAAFRRRDPFAAEMAHEVTHALQDQHFRLDPWLAEAHTTDERLARQALVEGDASLTQALYDGLLSPAARARLFRVLLAGGREPTAEAYLRRQGHLVYADGARFAEVLHAQGGFSAVDAAYVRPPSSTLEILRPERYVEGFVPRPVDLPRIAPDRVRTRDRLGAWTLELFLRALGTPPARRSALLEAWAGDQAALLTGGQALWSLELATPAAASELATIAGTRCAARANGTRVDLLCPGGPGAGGLPPVPAPPAPAAPEDAPAPAEAAPGPAPAEAAPAPSPSPTPSPRPPAVSTAPPIDRSQYVVVEAGPMVTLAPQPLLHIERAGAPTRFGGHVRLLTLRQPPGLPAWTPDEGRDLLLDAALRVEGEVLPMLGLGYQVELELPRGDGQRGFALRQAFARLQMASTPALGEMRWGVMPVPITQDSERRSVTRPLLRPGPVESLLGVGSQVGLLFRLDRRTQRLPLLLDFGSFMGPPDAAGERPATLLLRGELQLWGRPDTYRDAALGGAMAQVGTVEGPRWSTWAHLRWYRLLAEAELGYAAPDDPEVYSARAWQVLLGLDLLPQFFQVQVAAGDRDGRLGLTDGKDARVLSPGVSMFILQRRLAMHLLFDLLDTDRDWSRDGTAMRFGFDLAF